MSAPVLMAPFISLRVMYVVCASSKASPLELARERASNVIRFCADRELQRFRAAECAREAEALIGRAPGLRRRARPGEGDSFKAASSAKVP